MAAKPIKSLELLYTMIQIITVRLIFKQVLSSITMIPYEYPVGEFVYGFFSDNLADITHALQRLTEAPPVASLSTAVSRATSRISAMGERSSDEFPIPGKLLSEILKVVCMWAGWRFLASVEKCS